MATTKKSVRLTPDELEQLSLHDLADYLANVVMVLRRLPDVPVADLLSRQVDDVAAKVRREPKQGRPAESLPDWIEESEAKEEE